MTAPFAANANQDDKNKNILDGNRSLKNVIFGHLNQN